MARKRVDVGGVAAHVPERTGPPPTAADIAAAKPMPTPVVSHDREPVWLGAPAAARRVGVVLRTLYKAIDSGELPAYRFGRLLKLKQSDVDAYIEARRIKPGTITHLAMGEDRGYRDRHRPRAKS